MISVKLKFRPSVNIDKEGSLVFQLIHGRLVRRIPASTRFSAANGTSTTVASFSP